MESFTSLTSFQFAFSSLRQQISVFLARSLTGVLKHLAGRHCTGKSQARAVRTHFLYSQLGRKTGGDRGRGGIILCCFEANAKVEEETGNKSREKDKTQKAPSLSFRRSV